MKTAVEALNWRYATKVFDSTKKLSDQDLQFILEAGRLSPSSFGIEAWKFLVIENPETRAKLRAAAWDQPKVTDASHLILLCRRTDVQENIANELMERTAKAQNKTLGDLSGYHQMVQGAIEARGEGAAAWVASQTYIALGIMIETASMLEIDNCPMEGFDRAKTDEILGLKDKNLASVTMLALGYRGNDPQAALPKVRRPIEEVVEHIK